MVNYIVRKILYGILVLVGVICIIFFLFQVLPGDPARLTLGQRADILTIEAVTKELGLDKPTHVQFFMYVNDLSPISYHVESVKNREKYSYSKLFSFSNGKTIVIKAPYLRRSYQTKRKVSDILLTALFKTLILTVASILIATPLGIFLGVIAAVNKHSMLDNLAVVFSVMGISLPSYVSASIFAFLFGYMWSDFTGLNMTGSLYEIDIDGQHLALRNLILPALALGVRPLAIFVQLTRSAVLDVLNQDYVRTAVAKGLNRRVVLFKHVLRNALNPVVTAISGWFAALLTGAFFVEIIFNWKGLGFYTVKALFSGDFPVVMGAVLITATFFVIINLIVDIVYGILDPRVSIKG